MTSSSNKEIESRGATVEAAIATGLQKLGLERDQVKVIVIDEGSRGLLGIGSREAIVYLTVVTAEPEPPAAAATSIVPPAAKTAPPTRDSIPPTATPKQDSRTSRKVSADEDSDDGMTEEATAESLEAEQDAAVAIISELLEKMRVKGLVKGFLTEPDDLTGQRVNIIDISGDDLGVLIGPRGETLDSLQFLSRLMVAHKLHRRANFVVDVEGFRQRREQALTRLAERMADKARQRGEPIGLEPMSAYERRIIHMTLRDAPDVYTESTGEGKQRRVRIIPKK
ncbi:MAG: hypothetical protein DCC51_00170 [Anaerolineae bacterium]|nr:MAG: hypothetical protein DCC51_00170 [Anaerolineae bacterium]